MTKKPGRRLKKRLRGTQPPTTHPLYLIHSWKLLDPEWRTRSGYLPLTNEHAVPSGENDRHG